MRDPMLSAGEIRAETYESQMGKQYSSSSWIFQAKKKGIKDYYNNIHMFITWVTDRLLPSFRKMYWTDTHKPKMILVLDNAPYHHKGKEGCIDIAGLNKFRPSQIAAGDERTLLSVTLDYGIDSLTIRRDEVLLRIPREEFHIRGKISVAEWRAALSNWFISANSASRSRVMSALVFPWSS